MAQTFEKTFHQFAHSTNTCRVLLGWPTSLRLLNIKIERVRTFKTFKNSDKNNNEKVELLNSFKKFIFNQQSAGPSKVPPGARGPQGAPLATPLPALKVYFYRHR